MDQRPIALKSPPGGSIHIDVGDVAGLLPAVNTDFQDQGSMTIVERPPVTTKTSPGWFPDPQGRHRLRYHDGKEWTEHVTHYGPTPCSGCG